MFARTLYLSSSPSPSRFSLLFAACLLSISVGCGPKPLPAFANPPPEDASADDEDSGVDSEVP